MYLDEFREYCLQKPAVTEELPFGPDTLVFKVAGKMFAATGLDSDVFTVNLKCDPVRALQLREQHPEVQPGYHMNKKHWNTVDFAGNLSEETLRELIDHSYERVVAGMSKKQREQISRGGADD